MRSASIELQIEELVLEGFDRSDAYRISEAVEGELVRLLSERELSPDRLAGAGAASLDGGEFRMRPGSRAEATGVQIAGSVFAALNEPAGGRE